MALTTTVAFEQILEDTATKTLVNLTYHANTAVNETDVLKVNASALTGRVVTLVTATVPTKAFRLGELVTSSGGATGHVYGWVPGALTVVIESGTFASPQVVTGAFQGAAITISSVTVASEYLLEIRSVQWMIAGISKVELTWRGNSVYSPALTLAGNGYLGPNQLSGLIIPNRAATVRDGNVYVSTHGAAAGGGYTILLELRKGAGFAQKSIQ